MMKQGHVLSDKTLVTETKSKIVRQNESALLQKSKNNKKLTEQAKKTIEEAKEKVASSWPSVLPPEEFGFVLNKREFIYRCPKILVG